MSDTSKKHLDAHLSLPFYRNEQILLLLVLFKDCYCCSVTKLCPILCNPHLCICHFIGMSKYFSCWFSLRIVVVVQLLSCVQLFATLWTVTHQAPLFTIFQSLLKFMSTESIMLSNSLILCCPLLLLLSIFPSIKVFSNESALRIW